MSTEQLQKHHLGQIAGAFLAMLGLVSVAPAAGPAQRPNGASRGTFTPMPSAAQQMATPVRTMNGNGSTAQNTTGTASGFNTQQGTGMIGQGQQGMRNAEPQSGRIWSEIAALADDLADEFDLQFSNPGEELRFFMLVMQLYIAIHTEQGQRQQDQPQGQNPRDPQPGNSFSGQTRAGAQTPTSGSLGARR